MTGLAVGFEADRWHERAWHFLNSCEAAGVPDEVLTRLLRRHFGPLLVEYSAAPGISRRPGG
jgi:hypothetical protein